MNSVEFPGIVSEWVWFPVMLLDELLGLSLGGVVDVLVLALISFSLVVEPSLVFSLLGPSLVTELVGLLVAFFHEFLPFFISGRLLGSDGISFFIREGKFGGFFLLEFGALVLGFREVLLASPIVSISISNIYEASDALSLCMKPSDLVRAVSILEVLGEASGLG